MYARFLVYIQEHGHDHAGNCSSPDNELFYTVCDLVFLYKQPGYKQLAFGT